MEIADEYAAYLDVEAAPLEEFLEMGPHVRAHFARLFDTDGPYAGVVGPPRPDVERAWRLAELVYLHDAVFRFTERIRFDPSPNGLETLRFNALPECVAEWMERVQVAWLALAGTLSVSDETALDTVDDLYDERAAFVERAVDTGQFLPVAPADDPRPERPEVQTHLRRDATVDPAKIHAHLFWRFAEDETFRDCLV